MTFRRDVDDPAAQRRGAGSATRRRSPSFEIPVWTAAGYDGDLVLVPAGRLEAAADVLRRAGHHVAV